MRPLLTLATTCLLAACGSAEAAPDGSTPEAVLTVAAADQALPTVLVYKTSTCGCCRGWVEHLQAAGFTVDASDVEGNVELMRVKTDAGVPGQMATCHTAFVDGYVVEGHVPAEQIKRLLSERPEVAGVGVPGMPMGSPGMDGMGAQPYQVLAWNHDGERAVFAEIDPR